MDRKGQLKFSGRVCCRDLLCQHYWATLACQFAHPACCCFSLLPYTTRFHLQLIDINNVTTVGRCRLQQRSLPNSSECEWSVSVVCLSVRLCVQTLELCWILDCGNVEAEDRNFVELDGVTPGEWCRTLRGTYLGETVQAAIQLPFCRNGYSSWTAVLFKIRQQVCSKRPNPLAEWHSVTYRKTPIFICVVFSRFLVGFPAKRHVVIKLVLR